MAKQAVAEKQAEPGPLIPDGTAQELFHARRDVVVLGIELETARLHAKTLKGQLEAAQGKVMGIIQQAERGERDLFAEQVAEDPASAEATADKGRVLCPECEGCCKDRDGKPCEYCGAKGYTEPVEEA